MQSYGLIIFPASIYHIFFSYRGVKALQTNYFERLHFFVEETFKEFSINAIAGYILLVLAIIGVGYYIIKNRKNKRIVEYLILFAPLIVYYLAISKNAPYLEQRYILPALPVIAIGIVMLVNHYIKYIKIPKNAIYIISILVVTTLSVYGISINEPDYLYTEYKECVQLADKYKDYQFVYVGLNQYNHLKNLPEFYRYKETLILNDKQLDVLERREIEDEFVICIKNYLDIEKILKEVMEKTNSTKHKLILECKAKGYEANYYLIGKLDLDLGKGDGSLFPNPKKLGKENRPLFPISQLHS